MVKSRIFSKYWPFLKTRGHAGSNGVSFSIPGYDFCRQIMAQSWEVGQKIHVLLIKVPKNRVVFGYFRGHTGTYGP